jgi:CRP/FNR family transcriptional regulator, nitrogen fixation regulation protein
MEVLMQTATAFHPAMPPAPAAIVGKANSPAHMLFGAAALPGTTMRFKRNSEIYGEGEPATYVYKLISGTVRTSKVLSDGRRQIGAFYHPGEIFGIEAADDHTFCAEAITDATVLVIKRSALDAAAQCDGQVARELWSATARELARAQNHLLLLIQTAKERVAGFLLEMADREPGSSAVELPMSRQDIADYLGLTIETVSRTLTQLEIKAAIELPRSRHIVLRNRAALARLNA